MKVATDDDPRFDPESDDENAFAHDGEPEAEAVVDSDTQSIVTRLLEEAVSHYEEHLEPDQVSATDYYYGRPFGDEEEGRSQVVSTDVRDATQAQLPSLMRIFFGPERVVEFRPRGPEDVELAAQQTDFIDFVAKEDNPGFLIQHAAFKDALVRRLGIFKWWWDEFERVKEDTFVVNYAQLVQFQQDERVIDYDILTRDPLFPIIGTAECRVRFRETDGRARYVAVPPEEFVYTPNARDLDSAQLVAHVREVPADELIAMGVDEELIREKQGKTKNAAQSTSSLSFARQFHGGDTGAMDREEGDESQIPVLYAEAYVLIDGDEDGIAERRLFRCVGQDYEIVNGDGMGEIVDEVPFATLTPDPEPHTLVGLSNWDYLKDVQKIKSHVWRRTLDSLSLAVEPQTEVVEGEVNMQDLLNPEVSGIVRVRRPGMLREITHSFVGNYTLPVIAAWDEVKENRTGISKAAAGLDADSLQSATKAAVAATLSGAQQHIEMIARVFAETGMKRLYKGLNRLVIENQTAPRMIRLRGKHIEVDPKSWDADADLAVNIALGQGGNEEKLQALVQIATAQDKLRSEGSPLVTNVEVRNTLTAFCELIGFKDSSRFFRPWGEQEEMQMQQQMAQQPPQPDPAMGLVQVENAKAQMDAIIDQQKMKLEREKMILEDDRERDKIAREMALKEREIELKHAADINDQQLKAQVQRDRNAMSRDVKEAA